MRLIDADVLLDTIRRDSKKAIDEGDKAGSFWLGYAAGSVIAQPTIQPIATDTNVGDTISRQAAIDAIRCNIVVTGRENAELVAKTMGEFVDRIKSLPSV